jgi:hypothetical protein
MRHMGRGDWSRYGTRRTVEQALALDLRKLAREGNLQPGRRLNLIWRWDWEPWWAGQSASLLLDELADDRVMISCARDGKPTSEHVEICWTVPNFGGRRPWWRCPDCDRRCAILYSGDDHFTCRTCAGLTYTMSQLSRPSRPVRQSVKARRRLGWEYGQPLPEKSPGMHWATWERLLDDYGVTAKAAQEAFAPVLARMEAELAQSRDNIEKIKRGELPDWQEAGTSVATGEGRKSRR